jgi:phosphoribosyl 1,2-cyclic phosphodiesterase
MASFGVSWKNVHAVLLTHTHSDHWKERTFAHLRRQLIPLYCHSWHHQQLHFNSPSFSLLREVGLVRDYELDQELHFSPTLRCLPFRLRHDGGVTCGFRFHGPADLFGQPSSLAYAADLGCWNPELARTLSGADVLALEFNHDVQMEKNSGRSPHLIARVLGDDGHLSNDQAAALLGETLRQADGDRLHHVVLLHLSRQCNKPTLAEEAARKALQVSHPHVLIHIANQDRPGPSIDVGCNGHTRRPRKAVPASSPRPARKVRFSQPWLPGWENEPTELAE